MLRKFLCWIGRHEMVSYPIIESEYSTLFGHRCKRCLKVAFGQEGIAELAQLYAARQKSFITDVSYPPYNIVSDENSETKH
jgi:hypothetical protein